MHTVQIVYEIYDFLRRNLEFPATVVTTTVASCRANTNQLILATSPSDNYANGILKIMDGPYAGMFMPLLRTVGSQVDTFTYFRNAKPDAGDEVELSGGPLARAAVYPMQSKNFEDLESDVWITIVPSMQLMGFKGVAGDRGNQQRRNQKRQSDITLICSLKEKTTFETPLDQLWHSMELFALGEQVMQLLHDFRGKEESGIGGVGDMVAEPGFMEVDGHGEIATLAISFAIEVV